MVTREERDTRRRFRARYGEDRTEVVLQIERAVIGGDWGASGYTTMAQADLLGTVLCLPSSGPSSVAWMIGSGSSSRSSATSRAASRLSRARVSPSR